ncbi:MAG: hypothetical protein K1X88_22220 [Nannocystaceae bacterium]|nr:hypothetical protein [Nannocystaceae bacterium]
MPRPSPEPLSWLPSRRWPEPHAWGREPFEPRDCLPKYTALLEILERGGEAARPEALREVAARWPGALREAQLVPLACLRAREQAAQTAAAGPRAALLDAGLGAVVLWADLSILLWDLRTLRPAAAIGPALARLAGDARARWPADAEAVAAAWGPRRADARLARAWLAALAGCSPGALDLALAR